MGRGILEMRKIWSSPIFCSKEPFCSLTSVGGTEGQISVTKRSALNDMVTKAKHKKEKIFFIKEILVLLGIKLTIKLSPAGGELLQS